ncbi:MAG: leucine-rich repeat protein [Prevotella sp.]|nr:leucine-rich repeat protein [Prevotella sp.]
MKQKLLLLALIMLWGIKTFAVSKPDYTYSLEGNVIDQTIINQVASAAQAKSEYQDKYHGAIVVPNGLTVSVQEGTKSVTIPDGMSITFLSNAENESDRPTLVFPYQLDIAGNHGEISFDNLNITASGTGSNEYIINQKTESTTATVTFKRCNIHDVNCAIVRTQGSNAVNIGTITIDDCVITNQGTMNQSYGYVIYAGCTGGTISEVEITNSTFNTCTVGIVNNNTRNDKYISKVKISDCTFYNCIGSAYYLVNAGKDASSVLQPTNITISNVIVGKLYSTSAKGYQTGGGLSLDNFYQTSGTKFGGGSFKSADMGEFSDTDLFEDPENGDFTLKYWSEQTSDGWTFDIYGDPRWRDPDARVDKIIEVANSDGTIISYQIISDAKVKVVSGSTPYSGEVVIPESITYKDKLYDVTAIASNAFSDCTELTSVILPSSITIVGAYAFWNCTGLTSISVPNSVTAIGEYAFQTATNLSTVNLSENIEEIPTGLFSGCRSLSAVNIPEKVYAIGESAFYASGITSIVIPKNVQYVGDATYIQKGRSRNPFMGCQKLTEIIVEEGNKWYDSRDNCNAIILTADNSIVSGCLGTVIPTSVSSIGNFAFYKFNQLETITIPDNINHIGDFAFAYCHGLKSVICNMASPLDLTSSSYVFTEYEGVTLYVPYGTKEKYLAAEGWKNFENIVEMKDELIVNNVISGNYMYTLYNEDYHAEIEGIVNSLSGDVVVPATVKYKGEKYSVKNVNSLTTLYYYDETENKYHYVKYGSNGYDENIPAPDFTNVTSITFEDGIESISDNNLCAYWYCKVVNIPASVKYISPETYYMRYMSGSGYSDDTRYSTNTGMRVLFNDITYNVDAENKVYSSLDGVLYDKEKKTLLRCPRGWEGLFKVPDGVEVIDRFGFFFCPLITEIQLPSSVRVLGDEGGDWTFQARLFGACYSLEKINIPEGVERIESNSFRNCISLKGLTLPNSLKYYNTTALASNIAMEYLDWQDCELETLDVNVGYPILSTAGTQCKMSLPKNVKNIVCTDRYGYQSTGTLFTGGIVPEILTLPASIEKFEATQLFSTSFNSTTLAPLKKLYVLMGFMPDISENFFGYDEVRVGRTTTQQFPQTWADQCTLYVPENLVDAYRAHAVWGKFPNIVGVEVVRDIDPITEETTIAFEENDFVNGDNTPVDLNNTVINDTYFSINNNGDADGFFDKEEQCIVINKQTSNEAMQTVVASELGSSDFISNFTGMVIEVNGRGSIKVNAQTIGNSMVAVKIGNGEAKTFAKATKGNIIENYDVSENTYVYIYATDEANQAQSLSMSTTTSTADNVVKIFSITVTPEATAVGEVTSAMLESALSKMYSVEGKPLASPQKGINILKMTDGTTRKVVK